MSDLEKAANALAIGFNLALFYFSGLILVVFGLGEVAKLLAKRKR